MSSNIPPKVGPGTQFHRLDLSNISPDCTIGSNCTIHSHVCIFADVKIGDGVKIQSFTYIPKGVTIEDDVFIGPHVCFTNDKYPPSHGRAWATTLVKKGASIGAGAIILPGVTIGEYAKIGAGSVVTKDVPANEIWMGNPAHKYVKKDGTYRNPHD